MRVTIDPTSLDMTASVLRTAAEVLGEICPQVARAIDGVYAPPHLAAQVEAELAGISSTLHGAVLELFEEAADLNRRSSCCCAGEASSLPVPALVGLAFGAGAALSLANQVQLGSAVSAVAASGPGLAGPMLTGVGAASGPAVMVATAPAAVAAPVVTAAPISLHAALAGGGFGGGPAFSTDVVRVYDATHDPLSMRPALGIGSMVYNPDSASATHTNMPRVPFHSSTMSSIMTNIAIQPLNSFNLGIVNMTNPFFPR